MAVPYMHFTNGKKMPIVALGTALAVDRQDIEMGLNDAYDAGYRHIDTAYSYDNEELIGNVLQQWFEEEKVERNELYITTKLPVLGLHPNRVEFYLKKSLERLRLDYVDMYLIQFPIFCQHWPDKTKAEVEIDDFGFKADFPPADLVAIWKKMEEQVASGRTRSIGLANFNINQIDTILNNSKIKPAMLQIECHVYLQQLNLIEYCRQKYISVMATSPLGRRGHKFYRKRNNLPEKDFPDILEDAVLMSFARKYRKTPAQIALRFIVQLGIGITPKSLTEKYQMENIKLFEFFITEDDMKELKKLNRGEAARICTFPCLKEDPEYPFPPGEYVPEEDNARAVV